MNGFVPAPGKIRAYHPPGGAGIRVDSGAFSSCTIPPFYDPLISKLIAWGRDRDEAIRRMRRALYEYVIAGIRSNIPFHRAVMENERFVKGDLSTDFIDSEVTLIDDMKRIAEEQKPLQDKLSHLCDDKKKIVAAIAAAVIAARRTIIRNCGDIRRLEMLMRMFVRERRRLAALVRHDKAIGIRAGRRDAGAPEFRSADVDL